MPKEKLLLDVTSLIEEERPAVSSLIDIIRFREKLTQVSKAGREAEEIRKRKVDSQLITFIDHHEADGLVVSEGDFSAAVQIIDTDGRLSWDAEYLERILTPDQLEKARSKGKGTSYIRHELDHKKIDGIRMRNEIVEPDTIDVMNEDAALMSDELRSLMYDESGSPIF